MVAPIRKSLDFKPPSSCGNRTPGAHVLLWSMSSHDCAHDDVRENLHNGIHDDVREKVSFLP